jgi:putative PIN family toxin of toxin-antitoxin system
LISALVFEHGRLAWIRHVWQSGLVRPIACRETTNELLRVLAYPKFKLSRAEQEDLLADFLPFVETATLTKPKGKMPRCRDSYDQMFLVLARCASADVLVTGDTDLLALRETFEPRLRTAEELRAICGAATGQFRTAKSFPDSRSSIRSLVS